MTMKQDSVITIPVATACGNCGVDERRFLHHVRHRGIFRRLCTSCVLRLHPQSFCPTCFAVYERSPTEAVATCFKCYSASHPHCVGSNISNPYVCPSCVSPNVPIFSLKKVKDGEGEVLAIDQKAAKVLLAAARIAAASMSKAAVVTRQEAERRAKEAAFTRKRAKEALDHLAFLVAKEKLKRKDLLAAEVSGSGGYVSVQGKNLNKGGNVKDNMAAVRVAEQNRVGNKVVVHRMDSSNEVLAALNAVELRERQKLLSDKAPNAVSEPSNNVVSMEVEENDAMKVSPGGNVGASVVQNPGSQNKNEAPENLQHLGNRDSQGEKVNNGILSVPPVVNQLEHKQNSQGREENIGSQQ